MPSSEFHEDDHRPPWLSIRDALRFLDAVKAKVGDGKIYRDFLSVMKDYKSEQRVLIALSSRLLFARRRHCRVACGV